MALHTISAFALSALVASEQQCELEFNTTYGNCWGNDLKGEPADTFEDCCSKCAQVPGCEVFMFDVWDVSGEARNYCYFKRGCTDRKHSATAVSGIVSSPTPTDKPTTEPTTHVPTHAPTHAPTSTPTSVTTTEPSQAQCSEPQAVSGVGVTGASEILNVSRWEDCCTGCRPPECSYVAYGKYADAAEETWACFHFSSAKNADASLLSYGNDVFLTLRDDNEDKAVASCASMGLEACAASPVSFGPLPQSPVLVSKLVLAAAGVSSFIVMLPIGYFISSKLALGAVK